MRSLDLGRLALNVCAATALLAGCSGSQPPIGAPGEMPQSPTSAIATHAERGGSWMLPEAKSEDLLYVSDAGTSTVYVFSYPAGELVGMLPRLGLNYQPAGLCASKSGDVFVTDEESKILVYPHGGMKRIAKLSDPGERPFGCSVDPSTGNLAVTNFATTGSGTVSVAIYEAARGKPTMYTDPDISSFSFCGYDDHGNLFVDSGPFSPFGFAELLKGSSIFTNITLNRTIHVAGGVQWDGKHIAVGEQGEIGTNGKVLVRPAIYRTTGAGGKVIGTTPLHGVETVAQFWINGKSVVAPEEARDRNGVAFYNYPAGGHTSKIINQQFFVAPFGATVSLASK